MKHFVMALMMSSVFCLAASASDKPVPFKPGEAVPANIITTSHLGPFKPDMPAVLPMVVISFQTEVTEKGGGMTSLLSTPDVIRLDGITPILMQKITDEAQEAIEAALIAGGWQIMPFEKIAELDVYKSWVKTPDPSVEEVKRAFFSAGKGANTLSSKELERVFVGGHRPLVGNGMVLGGWTGSMALCKIGQAAGAKVILFRALVNFATVTANNAGIFRSANRSEKAESVQISSAEMQIYPPDASGATPARLNTDQVVVGPGGMIKEIQKGKGATIIVADPERYEKDTVEAIRSIAMGFVAQAKK